MDEKKKKEMKKQQMQKPQQMGKANDAMYKAMGGNVAGYYNKGGKVAGCGSARNKPYSK